ncbi:MAG: acyl-homoserine-lactone synthase [Bdellovibrionales bacterium]
MSARDLKTLPDPIERIRNMLSGRFQKAAVSNDNNPNGLAPNIEVVTVDNTANWFPRDPLAEIYHFRGKGVDALGWRNHINFMNTPIKGLHSETDNSDMQGTVYLVKRFNDGEIACVVRVHPSIDTYGRDVSMLGKNLPDLIDRDLLPQSHDYYETSRVIVDDERLPRRLPNGEKNLDRNKAALECLASSVVYSNSKGIKGFFCFMPTSIWNVAYKSMGMEVSPIGPKTMIRDHHDSEAYEVFAGKMDFTPEALENVFRTTGFTEEMLDYGSDPDEIIQKIIEYSQSVDNADNSDNLLHRTKG